MRRTPIAQVALVLAGTVALQLPFAPGASARPLQDPQTYTQQEFQGFTPDQLDNLVAPIALYADPLLAQVLLASTFPDEIAEAAQYVRTNGTEGVDEQAWDVSVKAVAHYPTVLNMMDSRADWTTSLGQAYAAQSTDVMKAVQRMRQMAQAQGNLVTSPEQEVLVSDDYIRIWPANPRYIYVPVYDPAVVFVRPVFVRPGFHTFFSFGLPFRIGSWLIYDWDWPAWRIVYTGWHGGGWIARSRPFVQITNVYYVNPIHRRVWFGRDVLRRHPDYGRIRRYEPIHPGVQFGDRGQTQSPLRRAVPRTQEPSQPSRRGFPRGSTGSGGFVTTPRPLPMETRPAAGVPRPAPVDTRPNVDRPGAAPREGLPTVVRPRPVPVETRPAVERPNVERSGAASRENLPTVVPWPSERRPAAEPPRWSPAGGNLPTVVRPRPAPVESRPAVQQPRWAPAGDLPAVVRPRPAPVESRPAIERPRSAPVESRPSVERGGRGGDRQVQRSAPPAGRGGDRGGQSGQSRGHH